ncbi:MAG: NPXTG-anchored protein [Oscillospiraceae bacterium]
MKITKILSTVAAAAVATSALACVASANFKPWGSNVNPDGYIENSGSGNYGIMVVSTGEADAPTSTLAQDFGFDPTDIGGATFTITIPETDSFGADGNRLWWDGTIGGGIVTSLHTDVDKSTYNWPSQGEFWGVIDEDLGIETLAADKAFQLEKVGDYTYKLTAMFNFDDALNTIEGDHIVQYRIFMQGWDNGMSEYQVIECALLDDAGNPLVTLTGDGYPVGGAPSTDVDVEDGGETGAVDTDAPVNDNKGGSPDTGVEGVAAVAGLAVVAAGAAILSKKRK